MGLLKGEFGLQKMILACQRAIKTCHHNNIPAEQQKHLKFQSSHKYLSFDEDIMFDSVNYNPEKFIRGHFFDQQDAFHKWNITTIAVEINKLCIHQLKNKTNSV